MEQRTLGKGPLKVSAIGLGLMSMSGIYGNADDEQSIGVIHHALERGVNHLDSADMYGWGHNEKLLGRALKGRRDKAVVVTKFGQVKTPEGKQEVDGRPAYVLQACEASLPRLGIDVIDLYYQHRVDPEVPIEDTVGAMAELVAQGKVRHLGLSEASAESIRRAAAELPRTATRRDGSRHGLSRWTFATGCGETNRSVGRNAQTPATSGAKYQLQSCIRPTRVTRGVLAAGGYVPPHRANCRCIGLHTQWVYPCL